MDLPKAPRDSFLARLLSPASPPYTLPPTAALLQLPLPASVVRGRLSRRPLPPPRDPPQPLTLANRRLASRFHIRLRPAPVALLHSPPRPSPVHPPLVGPTAPSLPLCGLLLPLSLLCFASPDASSSFLSLSPPPLSSSSAATRLLDGLNWRRVGFGKRWFASEASAAPAAELVEIPLAQTGEGIAEYELLHWFVSESRDPQPHVSRPLEKSGWPDLAIELVVLVAAATRPWRQLQLTPSHMTHQPDEHYYLHCSSRFRKSPTPCKPKQRVAVRTRSFTTRTSSNPGGANVSIPKQWYNLVADLHLQTHQPLNPSDLAPLFPDELIRQEVTEERFIHIPEEVADVDKLWRLMPLIRARRLEKLLGMPAKIYYKYEGTSSAGSHKPNTAVPQAWYNAVAGVKNVVTETGAGQWGQCAVVRELQAQLRGVAGARVVRPEAVQEADDGDVGRQGTPVAVFGDR
ncbi:hypothetical protein E2562_038237 [Oryza meyeriana var. granulata]|uniref:Tryptophan synthase beta chain-like PALP domain-containing protein n=1 Tax=Oryza meyeriana var. granulata TaxID=110450 RepID=A0A6G1E8C4_9ORYZ|nr:hypothetical protein E2562_038237 [Oryza meyeriana var. granulata]